MRKLMVVLAVVSVAACKKAQPKAVCPASCVSKPCAEFNAVQFQSGTATCNPATCTLDTSACVAVGSGCDHSGFTNADIFAYSDNTNLDYQELDDFDADGNLLWLENWYTIDTLSVVPGTTATQQLDGDNADYNLCGTCMLLSDAAGQETYMAYSGSAAITAPSQAGDDFTMVLSNLKLKSTTTNHTWCINSLTVSAQSTRFTCDTFSSADPAVGQTYCSGSGTLLVCEQSGPDLFVSLQDPCTSTTCYDAAPEAVPDAAVCQ